MCRHCIPAGMNAAYCFIYKINAERQTGSSETIDKICCGAKRCAARHPRRRRPHGASRRPNRRPPQQPDILPSLSGGQHVTASSQAVKELGVTTVQWAVLGALSDPRPKSGIKSGISLSTLAEFLVVSRQNLDGVLKRLERDGLVERVLDDGDKRARVVRLTPHGLSFWTDLQKRIYQFYAQTASTFRFDERVALVHYLNSLQRELMKVRLEKPQGPTVKKHRRGRAARALSKSSRFE